MSQKSKNCPVRQVGVCGRMRFKSSTWLLSIRGTHMTNPEVKFRFDHTKLTLGSIFHELDGGGLDTYKVTKAPEITFDNKYTQMSWEGTPVKGGDPVYFLVTMK